MSSSFEESREPCPCGKGFVIHWVKEDDHPWGNWGSYPWTEIRCEECREKAREQVRVLCAAQIERLRQIDEAAAALRKERTRIHSAVVNRRFPPEKFPSVAAEWRAMREQSLFTDSYDMYRRRRCASAYEAIRWSLREEWVLQHCTQEESVRLAEIQQQDAALSAQGKAVREGLPEPPSQPAS